MFFLQYLKQHRRVIGVFASFGIIFLITFYLYHLPMQAVWYPAALCCAVGVIVLILDFLRVRRKYMRLERISCTADILAEDFPSADGIEERVYQNVLKMAAQEQSGFKTETQRQYTDMVDYYTVWVHQIKTPIASMRLNLQNDASGLSHKLMSDLFRVEQYVEMALMYLKLDGNGSDYLIREYDLDSIVRQSVKKFAGEFIGRRIKLSYEPMHTRVITDAKWLAFVIEQVLSNALKYTPSGMITISLEPTKKLCIRDTGLGIAPEDLPRIFEKGYTGCNGRVDRKASGIGLYLCKRICGNLGHGIYAVSEIDKGTCVTIDLEQRTLKVD